MPRNQEKPRVILVDDDVDFQAVMRLWLSSEYDPVSVVDGRHLMAELEKSTPSLVILDVRMPNSDGFELCRRIRADPRFAGLPVLFLTGSRDVADFLKNFKVGGTAYLIKPIGRKQLFATIRELLPEPVEADYERTGSGD